MIQSIKPQRKEKPAIIKIDNVSISFKHSEYQELLVLENVNFNLHEGEIVALLGRSGSGKSTLLRIIAGLIKPSTGSVYYRERLVEKPVHGLAMVFQSFALMPWLTVFQNVELGLEAQGVPRNKRRARALEAIDMIGLDGFESAYPKELSGGMRQRVSLARALVINPDVLLMDEPFSALDVLTRENLRSDLLDLWQHKKTNTDTILMVTHSIEEAVLMADRILLFSDDPGYVMAELKVDLPHPRNDKEPRFLRLVDQIYTLMTSPPSTSVVDSNKIFDFKTMDLGYRLPDAGTSQLTGLLEILISPKYQDKAIDLPELADDLQMDLDNLFPLLESLEILHFADVYQGDIQLTVAGKQFADADILERKKIFASQLLEHVPLAKHIRKLLDERSSHTISEERFLTKLEDYLSEKEAERVLKVVIDWGRYAEIFAYNYNAGMLSLENPE